MTLVGVVGILLGLLGIRFAMIHRNRRQLTLFFALYVVHLAMTVAWYLFALSSPTDTHMYYYDAWNYYGTASFQFGTTFVIFAVQWMREAFGGTFLDYFFIFQIFGFYGICFLMRIFEEIYAEVGGERPLFVDALLFLPGLHFWTSSIGKDGALFLGVCLALWAAMNLRKRYLAFLLALLLMILFRPHIAAVTAAAAAATLMFDRSTRIFHKSLLLAASAGGAILALATTQDMFNVDVTNADSVSDFVATQSQMAEVGEAAGNTAVQGGYLLRLFSLMFRPFFIDANGMMGLFASIENAIFLLVMLVLTLRTRELVRLMPKVTFLRFALVLTIGIAGSLALVYYNMGLGLRQKTMFVPAVLVLLVAVSAVRQARWRYEAARAAAPLWSGIPVPARPPSATGQR